MLIFVNLAVQISTFFVAFQEWRWPGLLGMLLVWFAPTIFIFFNGMMLTATGPSLLDEVQDYRVREIRAERAAKSAARGRTAEACKAGLWQVVPSPMTWDGTRDEEMFRAMSTSCP
jgi:hypothetical protein